VKADAADILREEGRAGRGEEWRGFRGVEDKRQTGKRRGFLRGGNFISFNCFLWTEILGLLD